MLSSPVEMEHRPRILIVDDEPAVLLTYKMILEQHGFAVTGVGSVAEALGALQHGPYDVVVCDLQLETQRGGFDIIVEARKRDPEVPAVLLTGFATSEAAEEADTKNITVLYKPVDIQEFLPLLHRLARRDGQ